MSIIIIIISSGDTWQSFAFEQNYQNISKK